MSIQPAPIPSLRMISKAIKHETCPTPTFIDLDDEVSCRTNPLVYICTSLILIFPLLSYSKLQFQLFNFPPTSCHETPIQSLLHHHHNPPTLRHIFHRNTHRIPISIRRGIMRAFRCRIPRP